MVTPVLTWPSVYAKVINYGHVVRALHSPMSHNFLRYYPLSPHPPHLELKRSEIYSLPKATFRGRKIVIPRGIRHGQKIVIASSEESDYRDHILKLADNKVLGFDTEQNPTFFRGETPSWPCLVQLASERVCIMWRLGQDAVRTKRLPPLLQSILTSLKVLKVGCGSTHDTFLMLKHFNVNTRNFFDTLSLAADLRLPMPGLQGTVAVFLGCHLSKSCKVSNWSRNVLSQKQVAYASADAWASLMVYQEMMQYAAKTGVVPLPPIKQVYDLVETRGEDIIKKCLIKHRAQHTGFSHAPCGVTAGSSPSPCGDTAGSSPSPCGDTAGSSPSPCGDTAESSPSPCGNVAEHQGDYCQSLQKGDEIGTLCAGRGSCSI